MTVSPYAPQVRVGREPIPPRESARVLAFRRPGPPTSRNPPALREAPSVPASPFPDMGQYERAGIEPDDYRHRMIVNVVGFAVCVLLVVAGVWLANKIAELRRDQDCVLSGRRNCAQISINGNLSR
jgi:hypothetical protein